MRCPPIQRCACCGELLIHRGKRSVHESASYLGQIVYGLLPRVFTWNDIDGNLYRREIRLLRLFEHKSPGQRMKHGQRELLTLWARILEHMKSCPIAVEEFQFHPQSGVYLMEGDPHEGNQLGPCTVTRLADGKRRVFPVEEEALCWIALLEGEYREHVRERLRRRRVHPEAA